MVDKFRKSGKLGCFIAVRPPFSFHLAEFDGDSGIKRFRSSQQSDIWINGGYFIFRSEIFEFMRDGEELVLEPFNRLIEKRLADGVQVRGLLAGDGHVRDRQVLEEMAERGDAVASLTGLPRAERQTRPRPGRRHEERSRSPAQAIAFRFLCLGAHSDDIEIGAGGFLFDLWRAASSSTWSGAC